MHHAGDVHPFVCVCVCVCVCVGGGGGGGGGGDGRRMLCILCNHVDV